MKKYAIIFILLFASTCYGQSFIDNIGLSYYHGEMLNGVVESNTHDHSVDRIILRGGKYFHKFELSGELHGSFLHSDAKRKGISKNAHEIGLNIVGSYHFRPRLNFDPYIGLLVGGSWLIEKHNQPDFMDSGVLGTFGGMVGMNFSLKKRWYLNVEYRITHSSDPFHTGDRGRNFHGPLIGLVYYFDR